MAEKFVTSCYSDTILRIERVKNLKLYVKCTCEGVFILPYIEPIQVCTYTCTSEYIHLIISNRASVYLSL